MPRLVRRRQRAGAWILGAMVCAGPSTAAAQVVEVAAGMRHYCARLADGAALCWGHNDDGQLGDGSVSGRARPTAVSALTDAARLTAGEQHTCALRRDGRVACWGDNAHGQLGTGDTQPRHAPADVPGITGALAVSAGERSTCAVMADHTVRCWGENENAQLGAPAGPFVSSPVVVAGLRDIVEIALGSQHACALDQRGAVHCWGSNYFGQLGRVEGVRSPRTFAQPTPVAGLPPIAALALGINHACAADVNGEVYCWGWNERRQVAGGSTRDRPRPTRVPGLRGVVELALGAWQSCARTGDGAVRCWGASEQAYNPDGSTRTIAGTVARRIRMAGQTLVFARTWPDRAQPELLNVPAAARVAVGGGGLCVLAQRGEVQCAGNNLFGELGDDTRVARPGFAPVAR